MVVKRRGVSSVHFSFRFPFQLHYELVSSGPISFEVQQNDTWTRPNLNWHHLKCHSTSTAMGTRTCYWKPTWRYTDETPLTCFWFSRFKYFFPLSSSKQFLHKLCIVPFIHLFIPVKFIFHSVTKRGDFMVWWSSRYKHRKKLSHCHLFMYLSLINETIVDKWVWGHPYIISAHF